MVGEEIIQDTESDQSSEYAFIDIQDKEHSSALIAYTLALTSRVFEEIGRAHV